DQAAQPLQLVACLQLRRAPAVTRGECVTEAFVVQQRAALERQRRHHRQLGIRQLLRELVLLDDGRIGPAARAVELRDHGCGRLRFRAFQPDLPHPVLVAVQRQQAPIRPQPAGADRIKHQVGGEAGIGRVVQRGPMTRAGTTAMVMREMHASAPLSSSMRISHTWVVRPRCSIRAVPVTMPLRTPRTWFALMSSPTANSLSGSSVSIAAVLPSVSASATEAPPCNRPYGWWVRWSTGMLPCSQSSPTAVMRMPSVSIMVLALQPLMRARSGSCFQMLTGLSCGAKAHCRTRAAAGQCLRRNGSDICRAAGCIGLVRALACRRAGRRFGKRCRVGGGSGRFASLGHMACPQGESQAFRGIRERREDTSMTPAQEQTGQPHVYIVTLKFSGRQFPVAPGETVLEAAQRAGVALPYSCRSGVRGSCKAILLKGRCEYPRNPPLGLDASAVAHHAVLLCQAVPASDLLLEAREVASVEDVARRQLSVLVDYKWRLARDVIGLRLLPDDGHAPLKRLPGQYLDVLLGDGKRRPYSIANGPQPDGAIELHLRHVDGGGFTSWVNDQLAIGDRLRVEG